MNKRKEVFTVFGRKIAEKDAAVILQHPLAFHSFLIVVPPG